MKVIGSVEISGSFITSGSIVSTSPFSHAQYAQVAVSASRATSVLSGSRAQTAATASYHHALFSANGFRQTIGVPNLSLNTGIVLFPSQSIGPQKFNQYLNLGLTNVPSEGYYRITAAPVLSVATVPKYWRLVASGSGVPTQEAPMAIATTPSSTTSSPGNSRTVDAIFYLKPGTQVFITEGTGSYYSTTGGATLSIATTIAAPFFIEKIG